MRKLAIALVALVLVGWLPVAAQAPTPTDSTKQGNLYVVGTAHLDTQWRWTIQNSIEEYIPATFRDNFRLMKRYPNYIFSFEGAFRYMLLKEYYPREYQFLRAFMENGQWRPAGSWVDAVDVNIPSFESLVRQALYGNGYFKKEFGKTSSDVFLPDCFGFGYALPSIAAHCGIRSFSTQKLSWGSSVGVPFDIGLWEGVDGSTLVAELNPGAYVTQIKSDLSRDTSWLRVINHQRDTSGLAAAYMYFGTGDTGGSPDSVSVDWLDKSINSDGPIAVHSIGSDEMPNIIGSQKDIHLPRYKGELLMTRHGVGCYSSEAAMKRWNRKNELLADATERASVIGSVVSDMTYPTEDIQQTWIRFLWHQFHDDLTGTSIPEAYQFSWNDEILCQNRYSALLQNAVDNTTPALDTRVKGVPVVVYNPLAIPREDIVQATVTFSGPAPTVVRVYGPDNKEVASQLGHIAGNSAEVIFLADAPSVGYAVYDVRPSKAPCALNTELEVTELALENERYLVRLNTAGDVISIADKRNKHELLKAPIQLQLIHDKPRQWPAWEIQYEDIIAAPQATVGGKAEIKVVEKGPARVAVEVIRHTDKSTFRTVISLAANGDRIEFNNDVDWYERETLLKAAFPLESANPNVTYDIGLGTIERGINTPKKYEVPAHQWADMTSPTGDYGVAILNDCKYGWDHPDSGTLRLTLIHTPGVFDSWQWVGDQRSQDEGHHEFKFAIEGHRGDWRDGGVIWQAARLNQPLLAFQPPAHTGTLGKQYSLLSVTSGGQEGKSISDPVNPALMITAVKKAEEGDEIVIRMRELDGSRQQNVRVQFSAPVREAREINGAEAPLRDAQITDGALVTSLTPYQPRTFAVKLEPAKSRIETSSYYAILRVLFNADGFTFDADRQDGDFDGQGNTLVAELMPDTLFWLGIPFVIGPKAHNNANVARCGGQSITWAAGDYDHLYLLAAAVGGPAQGTFTVGGKKTTLWVQDYAEHLGQWNDRLVNGQFLEEPDQIAPEYINRQPVAWVGTHRHTANQENEAYQFTYLYLITLDVPKGAEELILPDNPRIRLLAATLAMTRSDLDSPAQPLYDVANATVPNILTSRTAFLDSAVARITCPNPGAEIHYTTDGSDPTAASPRYEQPVVVTGAVTLKARALLAGVDDHYVSALAFQRLIPKEAITGLKRTPGLQCRYFEGEWSKLPNFDSLKAKQVLVMDTIGIPGIAREEDYGLAFDGYISIPADGMYDFAISSDDGSSLMIADSLLIDNDGLHGPGEVLGSIALKAGMHPIKVRMFQSKGGEELRLFISGPGIVKRLVPANMLFSESARKTGAAAVH